MCVWLSYIYTLSFQFEDGPPPGCRLDGDEQQQPVILYYSEYNALRRLFGCSFLPGLCLVAAAAAASSTVVVATAGCVHCQCSPIVHFKRNELVCTAF